jgi:hypothetical protein
MVLHFVRAIGEGFDGHDEPRIVRAKIELPKGEVRGTMRI